MKNALNLPQALMVVALLTPFACSNVYAGVQVSLAHNNDWDDQGEHEANVSPRISYSGNGLYTHLEYELPIIPERTDGAFEWEVAYGLKIMDSSKLTFKHELYYDIENTEFDAELTPKFYTNLGNGFKIGFELEIDYLQHGEFDIYEIEIEPTIKWGKKIGPGKLKLELEAPVMRLYTASDNKDDFEFETVEPIINYKIPLTKKSNINFELDMPYNIQKEEMSTSFNITMAWAL